MRVLAVLLAVTAVVAAGCGEAEGFLDRYVEEDGRVVRHDQGGDTVSEGQAYAMLIAASDGDRERFDRVWQWTREHLQRPDGLLAWRWADGRVADREPAADADLDTAHALLLAAKRFGEPELAEQGRALGRAVAAHETSEAAGHTVLTAGRWARDEAVVNPGYWSPRALAGLALGDLAGSARLLTERLTRSGLPPDWARVEAWGVTPTGPPAGGGEAEYSYDALRVPIRLAWSCDPADHRLAARLWPRLRERPGAPTRALDGRPLDRAEHPAALAAAAAAADAAGDSGSADELLDRAEALDAEQPTYFGAALIELSEIAVAADC